MSSEIKPIKISTVILPILNTEKCWLQETGGKEAMESLINEHRVSVFGRWKKSPADWVVVMVFNLMYSAMYNTLLDGMVICLQWYVFVTFILPQLSFKTLKQK